MQKITFYIFLIIILTAISCTNYKKKYILCEATQQKLSEEKLKLTQELEVFKNTKKFDLFLHKLSCEKTSDLTSDEIYITILGYKKHSKEIYTRLPENTGVWKMNDGDQGADNPVGSPSHHITNRILFNGELKPGESYDFSIALCEEDKVGGKKYQEIAADIIKKSASPYFVTAAALYKITSDLGGYIVGNDDWIGMYGLKVTNTNGLITTEWWNKEGVVKSYTNPSAPKNNNRRVFQMNHADANYICDFEVIY
jgi:hypothetical protein